MEDDTLPGADPAPGPDAVFEWVSGVIATAAYHLGVPVVPSGTVSEERRHHASWSWPTIGRGVTLVETVPHGRQIIRIRNGKTSGWYEGSALRHFPGMEDIILRDLGIIIRRRIVPDAPGYPPLP